MRVLTGQLIAVSTLQTAAIGAVARELDLAVGTGRAAVMVNHIQHVWGMDGPPAIDVLAEGIGAVGRDPDDVAPAAMGYNIATGEQNLNADLLSVSQALIVDTGAVGAGIGITFQGGVDDFRDLAPEHRPLLVRNIAHVLQLRGSTTALRHMVVIRYQVVELSEAELVQALAFRR